MSDLYKQALLEAKKLKEIAEEKAKNDLMEAISPYIKKTINEEISDASSFFFEQEDEIVPDVEHDVQDPTGIESSEMGNGFGDETIESPIESDDDLGSTTMPDEEGMFTIGFQDLFKNDETVEESQDPVPISTKTTDVEETLYEKFNKNLLETSEKIDHLFFSENITDIQKESAKERLFSLLESLDLIKSNGLLNERQIKLNENKLEFLFQKLKEAGMSNSYLKKDQKEDNIMTTLKEYTARLFAEEVDMNTNKTSTMDDKHAAEQSGVSPEVGGPEDVKVAADDSDLHEEVNAGAAGSVDSEELPGTKKPGKEEHWANEDAPLDEKDQDRVVSEALDALSEEVDSKGKAGYGKHDTSEEAPVEFEVDEAELCEAIEALRKEGVKDKMSSLKETTDTSDKDSWEDAEPEGGNDPSQKVLDNTNKPEQTDLDKVQEASDPSLDGEDEALAGLDDFGGDDIDALPGDEGEVVADADADLVLNIELPDEVEDALAGVDPSEVDVNVELGEVDLEGAGDEMPVEEVPMEDPAMDVPVEEPEEVPEEEETDMALQEKSLKKMALQEARLKKAAKTLKEYKEQNAALQAELKEANLFIAKNVYFTKFLKRGDLSKGNLEKIVEHLDRAKTVKEAKEIYGRIKSKLNESVAASKKLAGSSSKVTKPGSAVSLQESKQPDPHGQSAARWQQLAGIKKS